MYYFSCTYSTDAQLHGTPLTQPLKLPLLTIGVLLSSGNLPNYYNSSSILVLVSLIFLKQIDGANSKLFVANYFEVSIETIEHISSIEVIKPKTAHVEIQFHLITDVQTKKKC